MTPTVRLSLNYCIKWLTQFSAKYLGVLAPDVTTSLNDFTVEGMPAITLALKDIVTVLLSGASFLLSGYALWVAQFNQGRLEMT